MAMDMIAIAAKDLMECRGRLSAKKHSERAWSKGRNA
jgi:hypothetical protein